MPGQFSAALHLLACPVCKGVLVLATRGSAEQIACQGCGRRYPVRDGIPVLIPQQASTV